MDVTPTASKFAGEHCGGVLVEIGDRTRVMPTALGVHMLATARELNAADLQFNPSFDLLAGTDQVRIALEAGQAAADIVDDWQAELRRFRQRRAKYLLY